LFNLGHGTVKLIGVGCDRRRGRRRVLEVLDEKSFQVVKINTRNHLLELSLDIQKKGGDHFDEIPVKARFLLVDVVLEEKEPLFPDEPLELFSQGLEFLTRLFAGLTPRGPGVHDDNLHVAEYRL